HATPILPPFPTRRSSDLEVSDRIIHNLVGEQPAKTAMPAEDAIVVTYDLPTAEAAILLSGGKVKGLVTDFGSKTSHTAILARARSEEHTSELQSRGHLVC